jgi:hypothetical protein
LGWQSAEWSRDGRRLFASAELACLNQPPRKVSGLAMMTEGTTWLDAQVIDVAGRESIRVRRYRRTSEGTVSADASFTSATPAFTIDDVKEASGKVSPRALEAALVEANIRFDLNSRTLVALDDAGVPDDVIDLLVALSFPSRFVVERASRGSSGFAGVDETAVNPYYWPYDYDYWPYYYAPFGYSYWGRFDPLYFPAAGFVVVAPAPPDPGQADVGGRAVNGVGYTRVRPRETVPAQTASGGAQKTGGRGGQASGGDAGSRSGSSGGVSSQGYSGSGGGGSGRTAQPRH